MGAEAETASRMAGAAASRTANMAVCLFFSMDVGRNLNLASICFVGTLEEVFVTAVLMIEIGPAGLGWGKVMRWPPGHPITT